MDKRKLNGLRKSLKSLKAKTSKRAVEAKVLEVAIEAVEALVSLKDQNVEAALNHVAVAMRTADLTGLKLSGMLVDSTARYNMEPQIEYRN